MIISDISLSFDQQALLYCAAESEIKKNHRNQRSAPPGDFANI
jgi:hypothetical protein